MILINLLSNMDTPVHDLVIRIISEYLRECNNTLVKLQCLNKRFYSIRHMFIKQLSLDQIQSNYAYTNQPYGWNKVHSFGLFYEKMISDISQLRLIHTVTLVSCHEIVDLSALSLAHTVIIICNVKLTNISPLCKVNTIHLNNCPKICDVSALKYVHNLSLIRCHNINDISALSLVRSLTIRECKNLTDTDTDTNITSNNCRIKIIKGN